MFQNIVLVCSNCPTAHVFYNFFPEITAVVMEPPQSKKSLIRGRLRRLGAATVLGQLMFQSLVPPLLRRYSCRRIEHIKQDYGLSCAPIPEHKIQRVESVNQTDCRDRLISAAPDLILVHGTRIISAATLCSINCPWVNVHAGITPAYRGTHGAYWALYYGDRQRCGVTVHLVDPGIDTGAILAQTTIAPGTDDNFVTYPWLQLGEGLALLRQVLREWPEPKPSLGDSGLHHHPTLGQYLSGVCRRVF